MQMADVYIASRTIGLAAESAAWRVAEDLPAEDDLAVAAYWFAVEGPAALHTCHHLHGGMGVDITYPLHRALLLGQGRGPCRSAAPQQTLAAVPVAETDGKNLELDRGAAGVQGARRAPTSSGLLSPEDRRTLLTERHGDTYHRIIKQMGADGWMGVGWPTEYGGRGLGEVEQQIFVNEAARADVHLPAVTLQTVGPTLMAHGTEKQKEMFLSDILTGDVHFAIGYSEPDAGTDLASLRCHARRDGDHYVVNGQKMWTTGGHAADYVWLAVRTDPDAPKHKGHLGAHRRHQGPGLLLDADHHRRRLAPRQRDLLLRRPRAGRHARRRGEPGLAADHHPAQPRARDARPGRPLRGAARPGARLGGSRAPRRTAARSSEQPDVRDLLAQVTATFRVNELLNWQVCEAAAQRGAGGRRRVARARSSPPSGCSSSGGWSRRSCDRYGDPADPETDDLLRYLDSQAKRYLVLTFGGGVNEVQRELVCMFGLGLPKVPR